MIIVGRNVDNTDQKYEQHKHQSKSPISQLDNSTKTRATTSNATSVPTAITSSKSVPNNSQTCDSRLLEMNAVSVSIFLLYFLKTRYRDMIFKCTWRISNMIELIE